MPRKQKNDEDGSGLWKFGVVCLLCMFCYTYGRLVESHKSDGPQAQLARAIVNLTAKEQLENELEGAPDVMDEILPQ